MTTGHQIEYYPNGQMRSSYFYQDGKICGLPREWNSSGMLVKDAFYVDGIKMAERIMIENRFAISDYKRINNLLAVKALYSREKVKMSEVHFYTGIKKCQYLYSKDGERISRAICYYYHSNGFKKTQYKNKNIFFY